MAGGDGRYMLNMAEQIFALAQGENLGIEDMGQLLQRRMPSHDKAGDGHYDLLSAFHKSLRGSDPHAALYYAARMINAEDRQKRSSAASPAPPPRMLAWRTRRPWCR
ncbi:hypothetical protein ACFQU7_08035 [Pseudoroseomonas wenyumeiae]